MEQEPQQQLPQRDPHHTPPEPRHTEQEQRRMGLWMIILMWVLILSLIAFFFQSRVEHQFNPNQSVAGAQTATGEREVVLERNRFGHYVATGMINNKEVTFIVDTGASDISIPAHIAQRLGLRRGPEMVYQTAKGPAVSYATVLDSVALGNIELHRVRASINPNVRDDEILLGMTFLKHLDFSQQGKQLTLRQPSGANSS